MSSSDGVGSPLGWLWATAMLAAPCLIAVSMILRTSMLVDDTLPSKILTEPFGIIFSFASKHTSSKTSDGSEAIFDLKYFTSFAIVPISSVGDSSSFSW